MEKPSAYIVGEFIIDAWRYLNRRVGFKDICVAVIAILAIFSFIKISRHHDPDVIRVPQLLPGGVTVKEVPVITTKTITKIVSDPADRALIAQLLEENAAIKSTVKSVNVTTATNEVVGGGELAAPAAQPVHFQDFRLTFDAHGDQAKYTLRQKFEAITTTSRQKDGRQVGLTKLYELGEHGERVPLTDVQTSSLFTDETASHWLTHLRLQAGLAASITGDKGGLVAIQWLARGRTTDDVTLAILSPAVLTTGSVGVLPFSFNLRAVKHVPLYNTWVSPYVGVKPTGYVFGGAVHFTF